MKTQITKKEVLANFNVYAVGYCELQIAFKVAEMEPIYYTAGVYGWNADVYILKGSAIVTGYRPFGEKLDPLKEKEVERYAKEIAQSGMSGEEKKSLMLTKLNELLNNN